MAVQHLLEAAALSGEVKNSFGLADVQQGLRVCTETNVKESLHE